MDFTYATEQSLDYSFCGIIYGTDVSDGVDDKIVEVERLSTLQPIEMTFNYSTNNNLAGQNLPVTSSMPRFAISDNSLAHAAHAVNANHIYQDSPNPQFEFTPIRFDYFDLEWPVNPLQDTHFFHNLHDANDLTVSKDCGSSIIQTWPPFSAQPPISPADMQLLNRIPQSSRFTNETIVSSLPQSTLTSQIQPNKVIGNISYQAGSSDYIFRCSSFQCKHKAFTRWYDLRRHYDGTHSNNRPAFWCQVYGCVRSNAVGGRPFPRKDKLSDRVKKVHGNSDVW